MPAVAFATVSYQPAPDGRQERGAVRRALRRLDRGDLRVQDIGEDAAPDRAGRPATGRADRRRVRDARVDHQVEAVPEAERDALEHRPGEVRSAMA